jgi:hypothetical protein
VAKGKGSSGGKAGKGKSSGGGKGGSYRSAISGRFVTAKSAGARARGIKDRLKDQGRRFDDSTDIIRRDRESG